MNTTLLEKLIRQLVPEEILKSFEVVSIEDDNPEELVILLEEKVEKTPKANQELVLNGFLKEMELTHFPSNGRQCFLRLKRRRWKVKSEVSSSNYYYNTYDFSVPGTKSTKEFGAFLKEFD